MEWSLLPYGMSLSNCTQLDFLFILSKLFQGQSLVVVHSLIFILFYRSCFKDSRWLWNYLCRPIVRTC